MAYDKVVDSTQLEADLTSVADKIREKADTADKLEFPSGFVSALDTIESADSALAEVEYKLSNGYTDYSDYFYNRQQMKQVPVEIIKHTENGTNFESMFYYCSLISTIPDLKTSKGESFRLMFMNCVSINTIEGIDLTNATDVYYIFQYAGAIVNLTFNGVIKITGLDLSPCKKLNHESLMSAINALFDHKTAGTSGTFKLTLGSTNLAKLTDAEKAIATQRGWTLA